MFIIDEKDTRLAQIVSVRKETNPLSDKPIRKGGFAKGKIQFSDDWDSKETNDEIAREFGMLD